MRGGCCSMLCVRTHASVFVCVFKCVCVCVCLGVHSIYKQEEDWGKCVHMRIMCDALRHTRSSYSDHGGSCHSQIWRVCTCARQERWLLRPQRLRPRKPQSTP